MKTVPRIASTSVAVFAGIFAGLLLLVGAVVLQSNPTTVAGQHVARVVTNPDKYYGTQVTMKGEIESLIGSRAFTMDNPGAAGGKVLVLSREYLEPVGGSGPDQSLVKESDTVSVQGRVQTFDIKQVEKQLGVDLADDVFAYWQGRPVIIADTIGQLDN